MSTDASEFVQEIDAGTFARKLGHLITHGAAATIERDRKAEITIKLTFKKFGVMNQLLIGHTITSKAPTDTGELQETTRGSTSMYQWENGNVSLFPENQAQMFTKEGQVITGPKQTTR